jgi:hypothetical protein
MAPLRFPIVPAEQADMVSIASSPGWSSPVSWVPLVCIVGPVSIALVLLLVLEIPACRRLLDPGTSDRERESATRVVQLVEPLILAAITAAAAIGVATGGGGNAAAAAVGGATAAGGAGLLHYRSKKSSQ